MGPRLAMTVAVSMLAGLTARPASAETASVPPGNPCAGMIGNPCKQNNGNLGPQGNANHEKIKIDKKPPPIEIGMPAISRNAAYIEQIGDANVAAVTQTARVAYANVEQQGSANTVILSQNGSGEAYADAAAAHTAFARFGLDA